MEPMRSDRTDGFTFLEVLIAMTIFSICLLGLAVLQLTGISNNRLGGRATSAQLTAQQLMEQALRGDGRAVALRDVNRANNHRLLSTASIDARNVDLQGNPLGPSPFQVFWNVADDQPTAGAKTIAVIVTWDRGRHARKLVSVKPGRQ